MESYKIVVPSRARVRNIPRILGLLPSATVCVAKSERETYAGVVPQAQLLLHKDLPDLPAIRNWLSHKIQEDCLVQIDDDLRFVKALIKPQRKITDPEVIREIIENSARVCEDLDIGCFCWSRTQNTFLLDPGMRPIRFVQPASSSFGLRGAARERDWDSDVLGRADADFTLRTLLEDRILYADCRFVFDHGRIFSGLGGNAGVISGDQQRKSTEMLQERWGKYFSSAKPNYYKKGDAKNTRSMSIRVRRQNPLVSAGWR